MTSADQMARQRRGQGDQDRDAKAAADLPRGVDQTRGEPLLSLLGSLRGRDRRRDDRHADPGRGQDTGNDHVDDRATAGCDLGEQEHPGGHHQEPGAEHRTYAEPADQLAGTARHEHDRQRHRQEGQAGVERREPQHLLQVERAQVPHREQRGAEQQHDPVGHLKRLGQVLERDERVFGADLDHAEHGKQSEAAEDRTERQPRVPAPEPRLDHAVDQHHLTQRECHCPRDIEAATGLAPASVGHDRVGDDRGGDADRRVDQQHPSPADRLGDDPAEQRAGGATEAVHRRPEADRPMQLGPGRERRGDDGQRGGGHERAAEALHSASHDQHLPVHRRATDERGDREQDQGGHEHPPLPELVGGPAAQHQEAGERDRIRVDHPLQVGRGEVQARLDRGQRHVDDAQVEDHHELRHTADDEDQRLARARSLRPSAPGMRRPPRGRRPLLWAPDRRSARRGQPCRRRRPRRPHLERRRPCPGGQTRYPMPPSAPIPYPAGLPDRARRLLSAARALLREPSPAGSPAGRADPPIRRRNVAASRVSCTLGTQPCKRALERGL